MSLNRIIISGGGTGGHVFPAIAIANRLKFENPDARILFIGAKGKMEMEKVPEAGYNIIGLNITGFQRRLTLKNLLLPFRIIGSMIHAFFVVRKFKPDVVVGVGGYASGPTLKIATLLGIPTVIQEQNNFPGKTNKILAKKASAICVAYQGLDKYFPIGKLKLTGNPIREEVVQIDNKRELALEHFGLQSELKTIFVVGGSLGSRTLNNSIKENLSLILKSNIQIIWQCGKLNYESLKEEMNSSLPSRIILTAFISKMDYAYALADVVISRAGAIAVSELCLVGKPTILVPSPNVAEDHQTKNAMALVDKTAALMVRDVEAEKELIQTVLDLLKDEKKQNLLSNNIRSLAIENADQKIVKVIKEVLKND